MSQVFPHVRHFLWIYNRNYVNIDLFKVFPNKFLLLYPPCHVLLQHSTYFFSKLLWIPSAIKIMKREKNKTKPLATRSTYILTQPRRASLSKILAHKWHFWRYMVVKFKRYPTSVNPKWHFSYHCCNCTNHLTVC